MTANIQGLISALTAGPQQPQQDPMAALLAANQADRANSFATNVQPMNVPNVIQAQAQAQDLTPDYNQMLSVIGNAVQQQRQDAENEIAQNAAQAQQEALMRRIQSMIPQGSSGSTGFSGNSSPSINNNGINGVATAPGNNTNNLFPDISGVPNTGSDTRVHLPYIGPGSNSNQAPVVAPPYRNPKWHV